MQQHMEITLKGELIGGEELVWSGSPNSHNKSIVSPNPAFLIASIIFGILGIPSAFIGIIQIVVTDPAVSLWASLLLFMFGCFFIFLAIPMLILFFAQRGTTRNTHNTLYAITNRRVIIIRAGNQSHITIDSFGKSDIGQIRRWERPDGSGDLIFASRTLLVASNNSYRQIGNENEMFMRIDNVRKVEHLLISTLK